MFKKILVKGQYLKYPRDTQFSEVPLLKLMGLMVNHLCEDLDMVPQIYKREKSNSILMFYPNSCLDLNAFTSYYEPYLGAIGTKYAIVIEGWISGLEEGLIKVLPDEQQTYFEKYNTSGKDFDILSSITIKIEFQDDKVCEFMMELLSNAHTDLNYIAMSPKWDKEEFTQNLFEESNLFYYRYIGVNQEQSQLCYEIVDILTVPQLSQLWLKYFEVGHSYEEFERALELLSDDVPVTVYKWELGLKLALEDADITVNVSLNDFTVKDALGNRIKLDFHSHCAAEKLFIKIIFPVK